MVYLDFQGTLSTYGGERLCQVTHHSQNHSEFAYISGRGIKFVRYSSQSSPINAPTTTDESSTRLVPPLLSGPTVTTRYFFPEVFVSTASADSETTTQDVSFHPPPTITSTSQLFHQISSTSTPNTSTLSHDTTMRGDHAMGSLHGADQTKDAHSDAGESSSTSTTTTTTNIAAKRLTPTHPDTHHSTHHSTTPSNFQTFRSTGGATSAIVPVMTPQTTSRASTAAVLNPFKKHIQQSSGSPLTAASSESLKFNCAGTNAIAFNMKRGIFAIGEKRLSPAIRIYSSSTFQPLTVFHDGTTLEYKYLDFSKDGSLLVSLGSLPDHRITIWDVESGEKLAESVASSLTTRITFDPRDETTLCSSGGGGSLAFWKFTSKVLRPLEPKTASNLTGTISGEPTTPQVAQSFLLQDWKNQLLTHTWGRESDLFVANQEGELLYFSSIDAIGTLLASHQLEGTEPIHDLAITKYHLITASDDGLIRFYSLESREFCRQIDLNDPSSMDESLSASRVSGNATQDDESNELNLQLSRLGPSVSADVRSLIYDETTFEDLIIGCADGSLYRLHMHSYSKDASRLESLKMTLDCLEDSHCGSISSMFAIPSTEHSSEESQEETDSRSRLVPLLATCGTDGSIRLWDYNQNSLKCKMTFNASFTVLKCTRQYLFVGSEMGYLRILDISSVQESSPGQPPRLLYSQKLRRSSILQLEIDQFGNCIILFEDDHVGFLKVTGGRFADSEYATSESTSTSLLDVQLAGFIKSDVHLTCIKLTDKQNLYVANDDCMLMLFKIPTSKKHYASPPNYLLSSDNFNQRKWKLDYPALDMVVLPSGGKSSKMHVITVSLDKNVKYYDLNASSQMMNTLNPIHEVESHLKVNRAMVALSNNGKYIASCADDGLVWLRSLKSGLDPEASPNESAFHAKHDPMIGGAQQVCFGSTQDGHSVLFSCGRDGAIFVYAMTPQREVHSVYQRYQFQVPKYFYMFTTPDSDITTANVIGGSADSEEDPTIVEQESDDTTLTTPTKYKARQSSEAQQIKSSLDALREEYEQLYQENDAAPDDERIDTNEFILDDEYVDIVERQHDEETEKLRESLINENLKKELLTKRIVEQCLKPMEIQLEFIEGLGSSSRDIKVSNYYMARADERKVRLLEKIKFMRRVEEVDLRLRRKTAITNDLEGGVPGMDEDIPATGEVNGTHGGMETGDRGTDAHADDRESVTSTASSRHASDAENVASAFEDDHGYHKYIVSEYDIKNRTPSALVLDDQIHYGTFDLYTRQRKVTEMWLLHGEIQKMKSSFNEKFENVKKIKDAATSKIERVNSHITDIVNELENNPDDFVFKIQKNKINLLEVKDEEISVEKWENPEDKKRRLEEERRKREALENSKEGEIIKRALDMMMDGRLEDKSKKKSGAADVEKPACMNKPAEELTEDDKKLIKEYEAKIKQIEEEETKKRKQLEAKLKNAQNDVTDTCSSFDQKLRELFETKLECDRQIYQLELKVIKLAQSIQDHEDNVSRQLQLYELEHELEEQNTELVHTVQQFEKTVGDYTKSCEETYRECQDMERSLRENLIGYMKQFQTQVRRSNTDGTNVPSHTGGVPTYSNKEIVESVDRVQKLFPKTKALKLKIPSHQEFVNRTINDPDPFADLEAELEWKPAALTQIPKRPDLVPEPLWKRFVELRRDKILLEYQYLLKVQDLEKKREEERRLKEHMKHVEDIISKQIKERNKFNDRMLREQYNLDYFFTCKQGQIEVEQEAVVTDYGDAILIGKLNVIDLNRLIINQAKGNIEQMKDITELNKHIAKREWENEALEFESEEMEEMYQRFQRLRVTKQMQTVLKTGHNHKERQERDRKRLKDQIEHTQSNLKQRVSEKKRVLQKIEKNLEKTHKENSILAHQLEELQSVVSERHTIHLLQSSTAEKEKQDKKMKQLRTERRLQDLAEAQSKELEFLRTTIQQLRERTFPSFNVALVKKQRMRR